MYIEVKHDKDFGPTFLGLLTSKVLHFYLQSKSIPDGVCVCVCGCVPSFYLQSKSIPGSVCILLVLEKKLHVSSARGTIVSIF